MMDIFNMLGGMGQAQQTVGQQVGTNPQQTQSAMEAAVPLLLGALTRNAGQPGGLDALSGALGRHDGSAIGVPPAAMTTDRLGLVVGRAWTASVGFEGSVRALVGLNPVDAAQGVALKRLAAENAALRARLDALEARLQ